MGAWLGDVSRDVQPLDQVPRCWYNISFVDMWKLCLLWAKLVMSMRHEDGMREPQLAKHPGQPPRVACEA